MFNEKLKKIRLKYKLSQKNVADTLGIDRTTYTYYETGRSTPTFKNMCKLCKIFNVTPNYFFSEEESNEFQLSDVSISEPPMYLEANKSEEQMLLLNFRLLDEESKKKVMEFVESLSDDGL